MKKVVTNLLLRGIKGFELFNTSTVQTPCSVSFFRESIVALAISLFTTYLQAQKIETFNHGGIDYYYNNTQYHSENDTSTANL
jgi:hypothetical protein